jgi:hypothetical protein
LPTISEKVDRQAHSHKRRATRVVAVSGFPTQRLYAGSAFIGGRYLTR